MVTYYKQLTESGDLYMLLTYDGFKPDITDPLIVEITQEEYDRLSAELEEQAEPEQLTEQEEKAMAYDILMGVSE